MSLISCTECGARLSMRAEICPDCGYPVTAAGHEIARTWQREYKLLQLLGACIACAGIAAAIADSPVAATISITAGIAAYLAGLLGAWWNTSE